MGHAMERVQLPAVYLAYQMCKVMDCAQLVLRVIEIACCFVRVGRVAEYGRDGVLGEALQTRCVS